jgi:5,10-methylenetetrahydromethanopterin reductase
VDGRRLGLLFAGAPRVPEMVALARRAEERGFESVWVAETRMTRDGFVPLAAIAQATSRVKVGTGIVNVYTRGPVVVAISFAALDEIAPGRVLMGLGAGSPLVLAPQGVAWKKPVTRLREYCDVVRPLLRGEEVSYDGDFVQLDGAQIQDLLAADASIAKGEIPLVLGVTGRPAVELAGEVADGALYNACLPTSYLARARGWLATGAARSGRDPAAIDVGMGIVSAVHEDSATGKDIAHRFCGLYLSLFPNIAKETGLDPELIAATRAAFEEGGVDAALRVLPRSVVDLLCAAGTPAECQERLDEYRAAGVQEPVLIALEGTVDLAIDTLR